MDKKKTKILVVDDEPEIVFTLKHSLSVRGYPTEGALNSEEAASFIEKENVDLILLDIMMPGMKGTDFAKFLKETYPSIKIIMVTGYPEELRSLTENNIVEAFFVKPVILQDLYNKIAMVDKKIQNESKSATLFLTIARFLGQNYQDN